MELYLMRHCDKQRDKASYNHDSEIPLSPRGEKQLTLIRPRLVAALDLGDEDQLHLYTSEYARACQTGDGIAQRLPGKVVVHRDARLNEINKGKFFGLTREERLQLYPDEAKKFYSHRSRADIQGELVARYLDGEDVIDVQHRVHTFRKDLHARHREEDKVLVVAHNIPLRLLAMEELGKGFGWYNGEPKPQQGSIRKLTGRTGKMMDEGYIHRGFPVIKEIEETVRSR